MNEAQMDALIYFGGVGFVLLVIALYLDHKYDND